MKVLNYGSLNVDYTYRLHHIVREGETILSSDMECFCGGKGLNQSIAMARAGLSVMQAGIVGNDGQMLLDACREAGVDASLIKREAVRGGHTIIQVDDKGQNSIILYGGTNQAQTRDYADQVLEGLGRGDYLVLQNEINLLDYIIDQAYGKGVFIILNPSPCNERLKACPLDKVSLFLLNEIEAGQLTGAAEPDQMMDALVSKYPKAMFVLTLGAAGAWYADRDQRIFQDSFKVDAIDTTGAGDTFTGYFIEGFVHKRPTWECLRQAAKAASLAVTRKGAVPSIPFREEVEV